MTMKQRVLVSTLACAAVLSAGTSWAQDGMPHRKPGLWETTMDMQGPMSGMKSQQCIDEATDEAMLKRGMSGDRGGEQCTHASPRRVSGGVVIEADCTSKQGKSHVTATITGDMQSSYTVDTLVKFDPPRHGMDEARMTMKAVYAGACPAGMKAGDMRMGGMTVNPARGTRPGRPGGMDPNQIGNMSPEQLKELAEQLGQGQGR